MEAQGQNLRNDDDENGYKVDFCGNDYMSSVNGASAIVIATEWDEFLQYDMDKIRKVMKSPATIYDFRCYMNCDLLV